MPGELLPEQPATNAGSSLHREPQAALMASRGFTPALNREEPFVGQRLRRLSGAILSAMARHHDEDVAICASVQRGLRSRAHNAGRLSVRREAG